MRRFRPIVLLTVALGAALSIGTAAAASMTAADTLKLCGLAAGTGLVAVIVGTIALKALRLRPIGTQVAAVALTTVVALMAGAYIAAKSMFISSHDLAALLVVLFAAGTVGVAGSLILGVRVEDAGRALEETARRIGRGEPNPSATPVEGPEELRRLGCRARRDGGSARGDPTPGAHPRGVAPGARRLGVPRPAHAARGNPGDGRGARGRSRRGPGDHRALPPSHP